MGAPSWNGCFMVLSNQKNYDAVQINFDEKNAESFRLAISRLFFGKYNEVVLSYNLMLDACFVPKYRDYQAKSN